MRACFIQRLKSLPKNASVPVRGEAGRRAFLPGFLPGLRSRSVVIDQTRSSFHHKPQIETLCLITATGKPLLLT